MALYKCSLSVLDEGYAGGRKRRQGWGGGGPNGLSLSGIPSGGCVITLLTEDWWSIPGGGSPLVDGNDWPSIVCVGCVM